MKKTLSLLLILVMLISIVPAAFAIGIEKIEIQGADTYTKFVGETISLTALATPTDPSVVVAWSSSNPSVATVDVTSGLVTAVGAGTAVITVNGTLDGDTVSDSVTVNVRNAKISQTTGTIAVGQTLKLTVSAEPSTETITGVTWSSSDPAVAVVADGTVTGKTVGTATITATATFADGTTKSCECAVTVEMVKSLSIDKTSLTVGVGETLPVVVTVDPEDSTLTYGMSNSNATAAKTATGADITGTTAGDSTLTVTAEYSDGTTKTVTCDVTVIVKVDSVTLNKSTTTIENGKSEQLVATVNPSAVADKTVTWKSSDTSIATVAADGTVTGVKAGTATITATSNADSAKSASCTVTVVTVPLASVSLNKASTVIKPNETEQLVLTVNPTNATIKSVNWTSQNAAVASVDEKGVVTGKGAGTTTITVTVVDVNNTTKTAQCVVTVPEVKCVVTMGKYYGGNLGKAYYSYDGSTWYEVTTTTGQSISVTNGTVIYFKMDPFSGYYRHPYVVNANGSYYAPYIANGIFSVSVTENKVIKLNFSATVPTGDVSMWQYVVAAFASAGTAAGVIVSTKRKK